MNTTARLTGALAGIALTAGSLGLAAAGTASAADAKPASCSQEQKQVDKADDALARVSAVFEHQQAKVKKAKHESEAATTAHERNQAKHDLQRAKQARDEAKKDKLAQQQRVDKAQARLDGCQAGQPTS